MLKMTAQTLATTILRSHYITKSIVYENRRNRTCRVDIGDDMLSWYMSYRGMRIGSWDDCLCLVSSQLSMSINSTGFIPKSVISISGYFAHIIVKELNQCWNRLITINRKNHYFAITAILSVFYKLLIESLTIEQIQAHNTDLSRGRCVC